MLKNKFPFSKTNLVFFNLPLEEHPSQTSAPFLLLQPERGPSTDKTSSLPCGFISARPAHLGSYYYFKEGDLKRILQGRGGVFYRIHPPSLLYPSPPTSRNYSIFRRARDGLFKPLKEKAHLKISRAIS
jgi:hypothetical protein